MYRESGGDITEQRVGHVDLGLMAVGASYLNTLTAELARCCHAGTPRCFICRPWRAIEPISEALKNENPAIVTVSKSYREPSLFFNIQRGHCPPGGGKQQVAHPGGIVSAHRKFATRPNTLLIRRSWPSSMTVGSSAPPFH
jgi:hypothetical protein